MSKEEVMVHVAPSGDTESGAQAATSPPSPRLQLRWAPWCGDPGKSDTFPHNWACHYELVLPLGEYDIRREIWEDGEEVGERSELVVPMKKGPTLRSSPLTPCTDRDTGERFVDGPIRDGPHSQWDSPLLGGLPVYVIAPDGWSALYFDGVGYGPHVQRGALNSHDIPTKDGSE